MVWGGEPVPLFGPIGLVAMLLCTLLGGYWMQDPGRTRWLARSAVLLMVVVPMAGVATVVVPNTFTNGTTADADEVNDNFSAIVDEINSTVVISGRVASDGSIDQGTGFSVLNTGPGTYTVTWDQPFTTSPFVHVTPISPSPRIGTVSSPTTVDVGIHIASETGGATSVPFTFTATGSP
jgi:predicted PurR-regulated permease PerM